MMKYCIVVCVNNNALYDSFVKTISLTKLIDYEIIFVDNFDNKYNIPEALNQGILLAHGDILIFCHQDILFPPFWLDRLIGLIDTVNGLNPKWGLLGIMGVKRNGLFAGNIFDPHTCVKFGSLPCEVTSLDEVCLILRKDTSLRFDEKLGGFHLYGADICLQANQMGLKCYAIDAPFEHLSPGNIDDSFYEIAEKLRSKWSCVKGAPYLIETTCGVFQLKDGLTATFFYYFRIFTRKIIRRIQGRGRKTLHA